MVMTASERGRVLVRYLLYFENRNTQPQSCCFFFSSFYFSFCVYISTLVDVGFFRHVGWCQVEGVQEKDELLVQAKLD